MWKLTNRSSPLLRSLLNDHHALQVRDKRWVPTTRQILTQNPPLCVFMLVDQIKLASPNSKREKTLFGTWGFFPSQFWIKMHNINSLHIKKQIWGSLLVHKTMCKYRKFNLWIQSQGAFFFLLDTFSSGNQMAWKMHKKVYKNWALTR